MTRRVGNRIVCEICGRPCRSAAGLADHEQAKHRPAVRHLEAARLAAARLEGARA